MLTLRVGERLQKVFNKKEISFEELKSRKLDWHPKEFEVKFTNNKARETKERSPEYLEMMKKAQDIIDMKEFEELTRNVSLDQKDRLDPSELRSVVKQLSGFVNVVVSFLSVFTAVFYLGELVSWDIGLRVLVAFLLALVVLFAEAWFYAKDLFLFD